MRAIYVALLVCLLNNAIAQDSKIKNVIIVTTDGFRWQEVFKGMDSSIAANPKFSQGDSAGIFKKYWAPTTEERRGRLMPFIWSIMGTHGQIYGNRDLGCKVNNANPYWFSYPGYNEIFCGFVDTTINTNAYPANPNTNLLEFLNHQPALKGRVAAFGAWDAFDRILNEQRSGFPVISGYAPCGGSAPDSLEALMNAMKMDAYDPFGEEALDVFTHYAAMDYLKKKQPRVLYISYGETDEWAHAGHYKDYLDAANKVDKWLADLWNYVQSNEQYANHTLLFITVDHGRGLGDKWTSHNNKIPNSDEIWFAVMGPENSVTSKGEIKQDIQLYQKQYAQTIAQLLGYDFKCEHLVAPGYSDLLRK